MLVQHHYFAVQKASGLSKRSTIHQRIDLTYDQLLAPCIIYREDLTAIFFSLVLLKIGSLIVTERQRTWVNHCAVNRYLLLLAFGNISAPLQSFVVHNCKAINTQLHIGAS